MSGGDDSVPAAQERLVITLQGVINADVQATVLSNVLVSLLQSGNVTDAQGVTVNATAYATQLNVSGTWGEASQPTVMATNGAVAVNYGGQEGLGVGDAIIVQFNQPVVQVPLDSKAAIDRVLQFTPPDWAANYTATWLSLTAFVVTVTQTGEAAVRAGRLPLLSYSVYTLASYTHATLIPL